MAEVFVAKQSAVVEYDGRPIPIKRGSTRVEEGHEILTRYPTLFEPAGDSAHFRVARQEPAAPAGAPRRGRRQRKQAQPAQEAAAGSQEPAVPGEGAESSAAPGEGAEPSQGEEPDAASTQVD